ncbi:MAG: hypothetical protein OK454_11680, partial [Thaumarchaeota archaeon]|nr:hypothetical protein [Nitrososphaerota archaeon]
MQTLSDDIAYIEAQGQGLQVQAANQKLLKRELESLLDTCAITDTTLEPLRTAPLETVPGLESIEDALVTLYKAMIKIDPALGSGGDARKTSEDAGDPALDFSSDYGKMRIVQEKKEMYVAESSAFMRRLVGFMGGQIEDAFKATKSALDGALSKKVDPQSHDVGREMLWKYGPLVLYAREVDLTNWDRMIQVYQDRSHPLYKNEFRDILLAWKRNARKPAGDEAALLFTFQQEKQQENTLTAARKLTVKRSQTLAKSLRSPLGDGGSSGG